MDEPRLLDTPVGFAQQVLEDAAVAEKNHVRLSEPQRRYAMLARAYLDSQEALRQASNGFKAVLQDLSLYKEMVHDRQARPAHQPAAQNPRRRRGRWRDRILGRIRRLLGAG